MTYIRKMKDWSEKVYYTEDEFFDIFEKEWKKGSIRLASEMKKIKDLKKEKFANSGEYINNKVLAYV